MSATAAKTDSPLQKEGCGGGAVAEERERMRGVAREVARRSGERNRGNCYAAREPSSPQRNSRNELERSRKERQRLSELCQLPTPLTPRDRPVCCTRATP